jgi:hypothetical protein
MNVRTFALKAIEADPNMYCHLPEKLQNSPSFAKRVLEINASLYDLMPEAVRSNSQVKDAYIHAYLAQTEQKRIGGLFTEWPRHSLEFWGDSSPIFFFPF